VNIDFYGGTLIKVLIVVTGPGQKFFRALVSHLWFSFVKFPLKCQIFQFFPLRVKKRLFGLGQKVPGSKAGWPLIYCRSKVSSAWVKLGQGPSLVDSILASNESIPLTHLITELLLSVLMKRLAHLTHKL